MCGRYTLTANPRAVATLFDLSSFPELEPRYNIKPTNQVLVAGPKPDIRHGLGLTAMRLGARAPLVESPEAPDLHHRPCRHRSDQASLPGVLPQASLSDSRRWVYRVAPGRPFQGPCLAGCEQ